MTVAELEPWEGLKDLLKGNVAISTSEDTSIILPVYTQGEMPNVGLAEEFIYVSGNGSTRRVTTTNDMFKGNAAIALYVKAHANGTVKKHRVSSALKQVEELTSDKTARNFFFSYPAMNIITPTTVNASTGYSLTVLNIEWHTT